MKIRTLPWLALLLVAFLVIVALLSVIRTTPENRTYTIGWEEDPPDQIATKTGEPTGFAVELVGEAARRRGIRLKWVNHRESSEAALRSKAVDLWPMMTITQDRKKFLHLTDPYLESEFGLFVDARSAFTTVGDLKQHTISYDGQPFNGRLLRELFPGSTHLGMSSLAEAVRSVCVGEAQAFFQDHITVFSLLLSNPPCPGTSLRMIPIPTTKMQLGIGATRESRAAADAIRDEISVMASDGSLGKIVGFWSRSASQELASLIMLQQAKGRLRWYRIGLASFAALFLFAGWSASAYRRQRIKASAYGRALSVAERNVRLVADSLSEMVVAYDSDKNLTYANPGAEKVTGYGLAELQAAAPLSCIHPEDRPQVMALWQKVFEGQAVDQVIYRLVTKEGTVKWVAGSWGPVTDEAGRQVGIRGTCQDITARVVAERLLEETTQRFRTIVEEMAERKRAEAALRESEERFRFAQKVANIGTFDWNIKTGVNMWTPELEAMYGLPQGSFARTLSAWEELVHPDDRARAMQRVKESLETGTPVEEEWRVIRPDGSVRWLAGRWQVLKDAAGEPMRMMGVNIDVTDRKQIEEALRRSEELLRESEQRLKNAERLAHVGNWQWDIPANRITWSEEMFRIFGKPQDYTPNYDGFFQSLIPQDRERVERAIRDGLAGKGEYSLEFQINRPDGEVRTVATIAEVLDSEEGLPTRMFGACQDITERKRAEETLRVSQQRFDLAQGASGTGTWDWDATTNEAHCSIGHGPLYGLPPSDRAPSFEEWLELIYPEDRARMREELDRILESADHFSTEFRVVWPDATIHWMYGKGRVFRDSRGNPLRMIGVNMDISDRKRAEAALRESEERFRNMADTAPVMIWVTDPDKRFTFFNKTWLDFTGRTMEQELGNGWAEGVHPEDRDRCFASFSSSFDARQDFQIECRLRRADGEYRWVLCTGVPRFALRGVFAGYIGSDVDTTDQRRAEATLRRNLDEIAHLNRVAAMGELTASIAHELNQPLAAILCNTQAAGRFLNRESPDLARVQECLNAIAADDWRAADVIKRLRSLLRRGESQASLVDLNEVVRDAIRLLGTDAMLRQASVKFEPLPALRPVLGDRTQLHQVVLNLIVNGLDAVAERLPVDRWVLVRTAEAEGGGVELTVEDSGKGIAESDLARVFEPFFTTKQEGLGMGLSISRTILQTHGGRIWAERSPGRGAIFHCVLPVAQQAAAAATL